MYVFYIINYNVNIIIFLFKLYTFNVIANTRLSNTDLGPPPLLLYLSADMALGASLAHRSSEPLTVRETLADAERIWASSVYWLTLQRPALLPQAYSEAGPEQQQRKHSLH